MKKKTGIYVLGACIIALGLGSCQKDAGTTADVASTPTFALPDGSHFLGCNPSDPADLVGVDHFVAPSSVVTLPASITLAHPPIGDQGQQGSCVGWGTATTDGVFYYYKTGLSSWSNTTDIMSASFVYNKIKMGSCNAGTTVIKGVKYLKSTGDCIYNDMTYTDRSCSATPSSTATSNAATHKITSYASITPSDITSIKTVLSQHHPVIIGIEVDNNYEAMLGANSTWSPNNSTVLGGHCNTIIGYDDSRQAFYVQNQWGTSWGASGFYWLTYSMMATSKVSEAYYVQ